MKIVDGFVICTVGEKTVAVASGELSKKFNGMISLNGTGEELFKMLQKGTDLEEMTGALVSKYGVPKETAEKDVGAFLAGIRKAGLLIE